VTSAELHAVVEVAVTTESLWFPLPRQPWPQFVRLSGSTSPTDVAVFLVVASSYGRGDSAPAASPEALLHDFPQVLPGGIAVVTPERGVFPGCCCGLESWTEWKQIVPTGFTPWTGHDPSPLVEVVGDEIQVWSNGGMGSKPAGEVPVIFTRPDFVRAIEQVDRDLHDFRQPLRRWLDEHAPRYAKRLVERFDSRFIRSRSRRG
jgi:hypothetical protein